MPWNEVTVKEQRQNFIRYYRLGYYTISDLAASFGISRKTAYKWIDRWVYCSPRSWTTQATNCLRNSEGVRYPSAEWGRSSW